MSALAKTVVISLMALGAAGCSGARSWVVADTAEYPISMSAGLRGEDGKLLTREQKHVVGEFSMDYKAWGMLWKAISFTGDKDISEEVNQQVKDAGGDAVMNLEVRSGNCMWNAFSIIAFLPDCSNVEIRGDIVKVTSLRRARKPVPAERPAPPPPPAVVPAAATINAPQATEAPVEADTSTKPTESPVAPEAASPDQQPPAQE